MKQEISTKLFRYDLRVPPEKWNDSYLNFEYDFERGHKNQAHLYFFTDSIEIALELGKNAAIKNKIDQFYLTKTKAKCLNLIDFRDKRNVFQMFDHLTDLEINLFRDDLRTFEDENTFADLERAFNCFKDEENELKKFNCLSQLKLHSKSDYHDISLFGQRITDFENGNIFKQIVKENYPFCDGYRWQEFQDDRGLSYCLFDCIKIMDKSTETITVNASS